METESGLYDHHSEAPNVTHVGLCSCLLFPMYIYPCSFHKDSIIYVCKPSGGLRQRSGMKEKGGLARFQKTIPGMLLGVR